MKELELKVCSVALSNLPVLIEGESGTGKETLAEHMHRLRGSRRELVRFYCGRPDGEVLAEELFGGPGCEAGESRCAAHRVLVLKHVNLLPRLGQQRLLATFQGHSGTDALHVLCTTVEPLEQAVARGEFQLDLYLRLAVCRFSLPPLRERIEDLQELFLVMVARSQPDGSPVPPPPHRLWQALMAYQWPGNLRELETFARSYAVSQDSEQIIAEMGRRFKALNVSGRPDRPSLKEQVRKASRQVEAGIILRALEQHRWNRRRTAQALQVSYRALLYKMKECRLREDVHEGSD